MSQAIFAENHQMPPDAPAPRRPVIDRADAAFVVGVMLVVLGLGWLVHPALSLIALGAALVLYAWRVA